MELLELLKQFKKIEPDRAYRRRSRAFVLSTARSDVPQRRWRVVFPVVRLAGVFTVILLVVAGGVTLFSSPLFKSFRLSTLDPANLRAEAEAIDIQIQLTDLTYRDVYEAGGTNESTPALEKAYSLGIPAAVSSSLEITIDQALEKLIE